MNSIPRFHLAFPVKDLELTRSFYVGLLECNTGRESEDWIDFDLYGHQIVAHLSPNDCQELNTNIVDEDNIPSRHFGVILKWKEWEKLCIKLENLKFEFLLKPKIRFKNEIGEQGTFFISDPSGNALEFKSFKNDSMVFKKG